MTPLSYNNYPIIIIIKSTYFCDFIPLEVGDGDFEHIDVRDGAGGVITGPKIVSFYSGHHAN